MNSFFNVGCIYSNHLCSLLLPHIFFSGIIWGLFLCLSVHNIISLFSIASVWTLLCLSNNYQAQSSLQILQKPLLATKALVGAWCLPRTPLCLYWVPGLATEHCQAAAHYSLCHPVASLPPTVPFCPRQPETHAAVTEVLKPQGWGWCRDGAVLHNVPGKSGREFVTPY